MAVVRALPGWFTTDSGPPPRVYREQRQNAGRRAQLLRRDHRDHRRDRITSSAFVTELSVGSVATASSTTSTDASCPSACAAVNSASPNAALIIATVWA